MTAFEEIDALKKGLGDANTAIAALAAQVAAIPAPADLTASIAAVDAKADSLRADLGTPTA